MKKIIYSIVIPLIITFFLSCSNDAKEVDLNREVQMYVGSQMFQKDEQTWFNIRFADQEGWERCYSLIFMDYEPGFIYLIKAREEYIKNPPQDGSSIVYHYIETISKKKE